MAMHPHHDIPDWSDVALHRTWRSFGILCWVLALANAFVSLLSAGAFLLVGTWAWYKSAPACLARITPRTS